ncbi:MAG: hypothetical protein GF341_03695, partial [candidate division Zixibacteria bacterium]|nr:hypothetical protein [candidate division Zixibacteria bacterium]
MSRPRVIFVLLVCALGMTWCAQALADTQIEATVDRKIVSIGDPIRLEITVSSDDGDIENPTFADMRPFEIFSSGRTQNISWINGKMSSSITFEYGLRAITEGEHRLGPATVTIGNESYETDPIVIK